MHQDDIIFSLSHEKKSFVVARLVHELQQVAGEENVIETLLSTLIKFGMRIKLNVKQSCNFVEATTQQMLNYIQHQINS